MALSADFCRVGLSSPIGNPSSESLRAERWRRPARGHPPQTVTFFKINMPLSQDQIIQNATKLIARRSPVQVAPRLPVICRPADLEDGWQVQQEVTLGLGLPVGGWMPRSPRYTPPSKSAPAAPPQTIQARHPDGNPRAPLYWLANFLRKRGPGLGAGQVVITGSYAGLLRLPLGRRATFDYANLARFDVTFRRPPAATPPA